MVVASIGNMIGFFVFGGDPRMIIPDILTFNIAFLVGVYLEKRQHGTL